MARLKRFQGDIERIWPLHQSEMFIQLVIRHQGQCLRKAEPTSKLRLPSNAGDSRFAFHGIPKLLSFFGLSAVAHSPVVTTLTSQSRHLYYCNAALT